jgi:hypothetical protein
MPVPMIAPAERGQLDGPKLGSRFSPFISSSNIDSGFVLKS